MKYALIITTVSGFVPQFEMNNVKILQKLGYEVHYATNYHMPVYIGNNDRLEGTGIIQHQIDFIRSPYNIRKNIKALKQLITLMKQIKFHLVHCHTPMGGVLGRIAAHKTDTKPVIYTAHGFHFYKGAPAYNWLFFYPVERWLARWTDCLITINKEDYNRAKKFQIREKGSIQYVSGVGIDIEYFRKKKNILTREDIGVPKRAFLITSTGELNDNKNQKVIVEAMNILKKLNIHYVLCGEGEQREFLSNLCKKYHLEGRVHFLGFRNDINEILRISDCFVFPSKREGLSVAIMEAMCMGLPIICSNIRGNCDLVLAEKNGFLVSDASPKEYARMIVKVLENESIRKEIFENNIRRIEHFSMKKVNDKMVKIYMNISRG